MANPYMKNLTPSLSALMEMNLDLTRCLDISFFIDNLKIWEHCQQANYVTVFKFHLKIKSHINFNILLTNHIFYLFKFPQNVVNKSKQKTFPGDDITFETRSNKKIKMYQINCKNIFFKVHKTVKCFPRASRYIRLARKFASICSPKKQEKKSSKQIPHHISSRLKLGPPLKTPRN